MQGWATWGPPRRRSECVTRRAGLCWDHENNHRDERVRSSRLRAVPILADDIAAARTRESAYGIRYRPKNPGRKYRRRRLDFAILPPASESRRERFVDVRASLREIGPAFFCHTRFAQRPRGDSSTARECCKDDGWSGCGIAKQSRRRTRRALDMLMWTACAWLAGGRPYVIWPSPTDVARRC